VAVADLERLARMLEAICSRFGRTG
jgi:hypothetical protein